MRYQNNIANDELEYHDQLYQKQQTDQEGEEQ